MRSALFLLVLVPAAFVVGPAGSATSTHRPLRGTFTKIVTGKSPALNGAWTLSIDR